MIKLYRSSMCFIVNVLRRFISDGCFSFASTLTFTALLAIVPLMLVSVSVLAAFPVFAQWGTSIQDFIFTNFVPTSSDAIQSYLLSFVKQAGQLSMVGLALLLVSAVLVLFNIEQAFNAIWRVHRQRKGIIAFLMYWALITLAPLLMGLSLALTSYVISLPFIATTAAKLGLIKLLLAILPFILAVVAFTILYSAIPNCRVPARAAFSSGIIAGILFEVAKYGFAFYLKSFNTYQVIYGALAAIPLFLLWIYISWLIILLGAEVCHSLTYHLHFDDNEKLDPFTHAYLWIGYLWLAQQKEQSLSLIELVKLDNAGYEIEPEQQMRALCDTHLVRRVSGGNYVLGADLHQLDFMSFVAKIPWKIPDQIHIAISHKWIITLSQHLGVIHTFCQQHNKPLVDFYAEP
ncbi:MAG: YihY family inner membrane protein [Gammaproteobacteria bacterium]